MMGRARVWLTALILGVLTAGVLAGSAQAAEAPGVSKFFAANCEVEGCGSTSKTIHWKEFEGVIGKKSAEELEFGFGPQTYSETVEPELEEAEEEGYFQAGGRVPFGVTDFTVASTGPVPFAVPNSTVEHIRTDVAPGLATSPIAVAKCATKEFNGGTEGEFFEGSGIGFYLKPTCNEEPSKPEKDTVLGVQKATVYVPTAKVDVALSGTAYNLQPSEAEHMKNGSRLASLYGVSVPLPLAISSAGLKEFFEILTKLGKNPFTKKQEEEFEAKTWYVHTLIKGNVEWGKEARGTNQGDYHDYFEIEVSKSLPLVSSRLVFDGRNGAGDFITNATSCPGHLTTSLRLTDAEGAVAKGEYTPPKPLRLEGCPLEFKPSFAFSAGSSQSDQPTESTAEAAETHNPKAIDQSQVKSASFTLPEGMTLNPSAAHGLEACKPSQAHEVEGTERFTEEFGVACPEASKIGTVTLNVPTLGVPLTGSAYLGGPESGPIPNLPFTMYVVANSVEYGVSVRLVAHVFANTSTGQVTTVFSSPPEQPFTSLAIHFERGVLAPVANPLVCGEAGGSASFEPTAQPGAHVVDAFGVNITGCAAPLPFSLSQSTANQTTTAGGHTSYTFNLERGDGNQYLSEVRAELPPGLIGEIPKLSLCEEKQANSETEACPANSQIGAAVVKAGSGPTPYEFTGPVYLTTSYNGAPYGLSIKVPAVAGPFNLGTVVTRASINANPNTAQVIADGVLPRIFKGIPLRVKRITVSVNKQGFLLNPTSCSTPMNTVSTLSGFTLTNGPVTGSQTLTTAFPNLTNCSALKFAPKFGASSSAKTSRANGASLTTTITMPSGDSNIKSVKVQLPKQLPSRQSTLKQACLAAVFASNPYHCPGGSFVGSATVKSPTLPNELHGPAILVSHAGAEFPDLDLVVEETKTHLRVILTGNTHISKGVTTTTFASTPDAPVSSVTVNLPTGSHSALGAYGDLCAQPLVMPTTMTSQSGKTFKQNTIISISGCGVRIVGSKTAGNVAYLTVKTFSAGRISGSGSGLGTVYEHLSKAANAASLQVPLTSSGASRGRPFKVKVRVGFVPSKGKSSVAYVTVTFR